MATYYVDPAVGNDLNAGTSEGAGNAWATLVKALATVAAGDKVWAKASASYNEIALMITAGTSAAPIVLEGYTATTGDGGQITVNGGAVRATGVSEGALSGAVYYVFKNIKTTGCTASGFSLGNSRNCLFMNCRGASNGTDGFIVSRYCSFIDCLADSNTDDGFQTGIGSDFYNCRAVGNADDGFVCTGDDCSFQFCEASNLPANALGFNLSGGGSFHLTNCTIQAASTTGTSGITVSTAGTLCTIINTVIRGCAVGITGYAGGSELIRGINCAFFQNTSNSSNATLTGSVTSDPLHVDITTQDFSIGPSSPLREAGTPAYVDIGRYQLRMPRGPAGRII